MSIINEKVVMDYFLNTTQAIARLEGKLDHMITDRKHTAETVEDHEGRIRSLERRGWKAAGGFGILTAVGGALASMGVFHR